MSSSPARSVHLVVSPASGRGAAGKQAPILVEELRRRGFEVDAEITSSLDHARELAASVASGVVMAVGGDGLVTAVANGLAGRNDVTMAIAPFGTANDFARALRINVGNVAKVVTDGSERTVDLGFAAGRYFTCIASTGFDAAVIESTLRTRLVRGPLVYPYAVLKTLATWKPQRITVETPERSVDFTGYSAAVANAGVFGGGMKLAPDASLDDGLFDVVIIKSSSKLRFLRYAPRVFSGGHLASPDVEVWRTSRARIATEQPFQVYADGEPVAPTPLDVEVRPGALRILVPSES